MSNRKLQNLFRSHLDYLDRLPQPLKNRKAISAIAFCRTPDMGTSYFTCDHHHKPIEQFHACRNRSCYVCALKSKQDWIEKQKARLLVNQRAKLTRVLGETALKSYHPD